jgi:hypothetical protein
MKKIAFLTLVCIFINLSSKSQLVKQDLPKGMAPDVKYWFSETELKNSVELASKTGRLVRRCFIDGIEFTEQGYIKNPYAPKDSRSVARISESDKTQHVTKFIFSHPDDVEKMVFWNSNVQFAKF